ncbi:hypothetical protein [Aureimonas endophytica]|uniref:hypothetical protein n=1 Tax=Aureimonas endophytica TaxID=2027858 RepID=UPI00166EC025|nr:hypothetical protein [Aureimonas endophytica]
MEFRDKTPRSRGGRHRFAHPVRATETMPKDGLDEGGASRGRGPAQSEGRIPIRAWIADWRRREFVRRPAPHLYEGKKSVVYKGLTQGRA